MTDNNNWKFKMTEWRGYITGRLESINSDIKDIKNSVDTLCRQHSEESRRIGDKIDKINLRISKTDIKVAAIGATVSLIVAIICQLLF